MEDIQAYSLKLQVVVWTKISNLNIHTVRVCHHSLIKILSGSPVHLSSGIFGHKTKLKAMQERRWCNKWKYITMLCLEYAIMLMNI